MTSDNNLFPTTEQEVKRAADELAAIKAQVKEFLAKLTQIEKRLATIAQPAKPKPAPKSAKTAKQTISNEYLDTLFEGLTAKFKANDESVVGELQEKAKDELLALAKHLGCKTAKTATKPALTDAILGRLRESKLLTSGIA